MPQYVAYQKNVVYAFIKLSAKSHSFNNLCTMDGLSCPTMWPTEIFIPFLSFSDNLLQDIHIIFQKILLILLRWHRNMFKFGLGCTPLNVKANNSNQLLQWCNETCSPLHIEIRSELVLCVP